MIVYIKNNTANIKTYLGSDILASQYRLLDPQEIINWSNDSSLLSDIGSGDAIVAKDNSGSNDITDVSDAINYLKGAYSEVKIIADEAASQPFAAKVLANGKKLFRRKHGVIQTISANSSETISIVVPYASCKINKAEVVNCAAGDTVDFKVHDTDAGTISGVSDYMLNQFGFTVALPDNFYVDESNYDADLIQGMKVKFTYTNNTSSDRDIGINVTFHELVS